MDEKRSLGGLIARLVDEIALYGKAGALPSDIVTHIKSYYSEPSDNDSRPADDPRPRLLPSDDTRFMFDSTFVEYIWRLLIRNPDIRVDAHDQYDDPSTAKALTSHGSTRIDRQENSEVITPFAYNNDTPQPEIPLQAPQNATVSQGGENRNDDATAGQSTALGFSSNLERVRRSNETALVSAPAREAPVAKTALIAQSIGHEDRFFATESRIWHAIAGHKPDYTRVRNLDFVCLSIIAACGPKGIPQTDLVRISGQDKRSVPTRTDRLYKDGYITKQPVTIVHDEKTKHTSHLTLKRFSEISNAIVGGFTDNAHTSFENAKGKKRRSTNELNSFGQKIGQEAGDALPQGGNPVNVDGSRHVSFIAAPVKDWAPDQNLVDQIFNIVDQTGTQGVSLDDISMLLVSPFYRRPVEDLLTIIANSWQSSQPPHFRHLAIVQDHIQKENTLVYLCYTFENYKKLVEGGQKTWEEMFLLQNVENESTLSAAPEDLQCNPDEDGFPESIAGEFQGLDHDASPSECVAAATPASVSIDTRSPDQPRKKARRKVAATDGRRSNTTAVVRGRGRPRKYQTVGIPADIESWSLDDIRGLYESRRMYEKYQKEKIVNEIERRLEEGEDAVSVTHELLETTDALRKEQGEQPMSKFLVMQILHEYAGGAEPLAEDDNLTKLKNMVKAAGISPRKKTHSRPSDATSEVHPVTAAISATRRTSGLESVGFRIRRQPKAFDQSPISRKSNGEKKPGKSPKKIFLFWQLPSVAAHSRPHRDISSANVENGSPNERTNHWKLPSVAAHSRPHYSSSSAAAKAHRTPEMLKERKSDAAPGVKTESKKRGRPREVIDVDRVSLEEVSTAKRHRINIKGDYGAVPSIGASEPSLAPAVATQEKSPSNPREKTPQVFMPTYKPSPWMVHKVMSEKYEKAVASVVRPSHGFFVTKTAQRYKRRDDPVSMTTRTYRVAIFKLPGLRSYPWFVIRSPSALSAYRTEPQGQEETTEIQVPDNSSRLITLQDKDGDSDATMATAPSSPFPDDLQRIRPATVPIPVEPFSTTPLATGFSQITPAPPKLGMFVHKGPLPKIHPALTRQLEAPPSQVHPIERDANTLCSRKSATPSRPTSAARSASDSSAIGSGMSNATDCVTVAESNSPPQNGGPVQAMVESHGMARTSDPGDRVFMASELKSFPHFTRNPTVTPSEPQASNRDQKQVSQHSRKLIFKLSGLKDLAWFTQDPSDAEPNPKPNPMSSNSSSQDNTSYYKAPTADEQRLSIINRLPTPRERKGPKNKQRTSGSTAILRRDIVLHIVQKCGGVFPEASAMTDPFGQEWKVRGEPGIPTRSTVIKAVNVCCEQGKLRRIVFSFRDHHGLTATSTVFVMPEIDSNDPMVKELQDMIKENYPAIFVPEQVATKESGTAISKETIRQQMLQKAADKQARVDEAKSMAFASPEERGAYLTALQSSDHSEQEKTALSRLAEPSIRKLQRLVSTKATGLTPSARLINMQGNDTVPSRQLTWLSSDHMSSEQSLEEERNMPSKPSSINVSRVLRHGKEQIDEFRVHSEKSRQRTRELPESVSQVERSQTTTYEARQNRLYADSNHSQYGANYPEESFTSDVMDPAITIHDASGTLSTGLSGRRVVETSLRAEKESLKRKRLEVEGYIFPGFMDPILIYHHTTGTFSASFPGFRVGLMKSSYGGFAKSHLNVDSPAGWKSPSPSRRVENKTPVQSRNYKYQAPSFPGLMGRDIDHPETGTFSAKFMGFQPERAPAAMVASINDWERSVRDTDEDEIAEFEPPKPYKRPYRKRIRANDAAGMADRVHLNDYNGKRHHTDSMGGNGTLDNLDKEFSPGRPLSRPTKVRTLCGTHEAEDLSKDDAFRLFIAVLVVRILAGGLRMTIDWTLVAKVFAPVHDETFLRSKWSAILAKMRNNQAKMDADFRTLFAIAYEEGTVPKLDFDHLEDYDWKWLVEWAMACLNSTAVAGPEILTKHSTFHQRYTLKETFQEKDLTHFYEFDGSSNRNLRTSVINSQAYVCHLFPSGPNALSHESSRKEQLAIARSWIRANVLTPAATYDPKTAREKLNTLPVPIVEAALSSLLSDKVVTERYKNRNVPGRDYEISDFFEKRLRTNISPLQFHRAATFKVQLDHFFETEGRARWSPLAHDGDAMAILNLVASKKIKITPIDPPLNRWGLTDDGYQTRQMDKSKLNFEMDIVPTPEYVLGAPLEPFPPPPASHLDMNAAQPGKIPVWYDINDHLIPKIWTPVLAAVLGLVAIRPGASAAELQINLRPSLEVWEVEEVLAWMVKARVAEKVGKVGYATKEWWWMALGEPAETAWVEGSYSLGFATTATKKSKVPRRAHQKVKEKQRKRRRTSSHAEIKVQDTVEEDAMELD